MVTELALLGIRPGEGTAFEAAFAGVRELLVAAEGYIRHRLVPLADQADAYLLEVEWRDMASHVEMFEPSEAHARFMAPLNSFFVAEPSVIHVPTWAR